MDAVGVMLIIVAALILLGALGEFVFSKTGIPDAIWLVGAGILLGPVLQIVSADLLRPAVPYFGAVALVVILTGGAYRLQFAEVTEAAPRALLLAILGFMFSVAAICAFFWVGIQAGWILPSKPLYWALVGGILGGSSALIVMPTVSGGKVDSKIARTLEVESSATDALCVVVVMALLDLLVGGITDVTQPFVTLARQIGVGVGAGVVFSILLVPFYPMMRSHKQSYIMLVAAMFLLYALTNAAQGNGAMAVLVAALLLGNATTIVPRLIPGAHAQAFQPSAEGRTMQDQITFLIKSFFFVLIGLMFPTEPRAIVLGAAAAFTLLIFRVPAVALAVRGHNPSRKNFMLLVVAMPRGLAAGVLSTLPAQLGLPHTATLSGAVFAAIVTTILIFSLGVTLAFWMPDAEK